MVEQFVCRSFVVCMRICFIHVTRKMKNKGNKNENKKSQHDPHWMRRPKSFSRMQGVPSRDIAYQFFIYMYIYLKKKNQRQNCRNSEVSLFDGSKNKTNVLTTGKLFLYVPHFFFVFTSTEEIKLKKTRQKHIKSNIMKYCAWFH